MTGSKIFLGFLVLCALLYAAGVGIGFRQNDTQPNPHSFSPPNWTNSLSDWLSPALDLKTLQATPSGCLEPAQKMFTLAASATCKVQIPVSKDKYRKSRLHLASGTSADLTYTSTSSSDDPSLAKQQLSWPGKDPQSLVVLADGGSMVVTCGGKAGCQIQIQ